MVDFSDLVVSTDPTRPDQWGAKLKAHLATLDPTQVWATGQTYLAGQKLVSVGGHPIDVLLNHTSGVYATDLTAGKLRDNADAYAPLSAFYAEQYGADPTGVADSTTAWQNCANAAFAASAADGITRQVQALNGAKYKLATITTDGATSWAVKGTGDNVHFDFGTAEFDVTSALGNVSVFLFNAAGRTGGAGSMDFTNWCTRSTTYPITPLAAKGAVTVAFQNPGDESNFAVGNWVLLRAGQCIPGGTDQPDGELNQVTAVDTGAHTVTVKWATSKPYQVEYNIAAGNNQTSTTTTAFGTVQPAIANVNAKIGTNVKVKGGRFNAPVQNAWVEFLHYFDSHVEDVRGVYDGAMVTHQFCRRLSQKQIRGERTGTTNTFTAIAAGVATCDNDYVIEDIWSHGNLTALHLHEGAAQGTVKNVFLSCADSDPSQGYGLSIAARLYDYTVDSVNIRGGNANAPVIADQYSNGGGTLSNVHAYSPIAANSFSISASGMLLVGCDPGPGGYVVASGSKWIDRLTALTADSTGKLPATQLPASLQELIAWAATFPGLAGNYFSTPDTATNSIVGDIEIRVKVVAGSSGRPAAQAAYISKYGSAGQISWALVIGTTGQLALYWTEDGTNLKVATSGAGSGIMPSTFTVDTWIRAQLSVAGLGSAYTVKFFTSPDKVTWTQAGSTVTGGAVTSIFNSTTELEIGSTNAGVANLCSSTISQAEISNVIGGAAVNHWQPNGSGGAAYISPTGETWTSHGTSLAYTSGGGVQVLITGSKGGNAAIASIASALASLGLVVDGTT